MTSQANIKIVLDAVNNAGKALEDVRNQLQGVGTAAEDTQKKTGLLGTAFGNLGGIVAGLAGSAGLAKMVSEATDSDKSFVRMQLRLGGLTDTLRSSFIPQIQSAASNFQKLGYGSDELAQEWIAKLLPVFKNDLPRAVNATGTAMILNKYDVGNMAAIMNIVGEDSQFAQIAMTKLAKAVGLDVNPKMDDLGEILEKVSARLKKIQLPPFVQEISALWGNISDILEGVGTKILKIINPILAGINKLFELPVVGELAQWAAGFGAVALALGGFLKTIGLAPAVIAGLKAAWAGFTAILAGTGAVSLATVGWIALIVAAVVGLGYIIYKAVTDWEGFKKTMLSIFMAIGEAVISVFEFILKTVKQLGEGIVSAFNWLSDKALYAVGYMVGSVVKFFSVDLPNGISYFVTSFVPRAVTTIVQLFAQLPPLIANALSSLPNVFSNIFTTAKNIVSSILSDIWNWVEQLPSKLLDSIRNGINWVVDKINSFISGYNAAVPEGMEIKAIPKLAEGGIVTRPTIAMVGEAGAEAVLPLNRLAGIGGGATINIDFSGSVLLSENVAVQIGDKIIDRLRKNMRIPSRSF